jgi:hypothetical protein
MIVDVYQVELSKCLKVTRRKRHVQQLSHPGPPPLSLPPLLTTTRLRPLSRLFFATQKCPLRKGYYDERFTAPPFLILSIFLPNSTHPLSQCPFDKNPLSLCLIFPLLLQRSAMFTSRALFLFALTFLVLSLVHFDSAAATALHMRAPNAEKLRQFSYKNSALRIRKAGTRVSSSLSLSPSPTPSRSSSSSRTTTVHTQTTTTHRQTTNTPPAPPATSQPTPGVA